MGLIDSLVKDKWLESPDIISAFRKIKREDFLPDGLKTFAELNEAIPIDYGQTISQPLVVAFMLEKLGPKPGDKILDIGSGSGWTAALLAHIVGEKGKVVAIEVISELKEFGERNVSKYNFIKKGIVKFICADGSNGYEEDAPYDRILASASGKKLPMAWKNQLRTGGIIVAPIGNSIWVFEKKAEKEFKQFEYPGFVFVPLVS
ncbi:MAG: protein-L-isoaspartate O-methyltransferase [Candidatus Nealsonbacteria bacterium]|nr:protein-L-isoaspartate O-methyltransferase [Candidatus Nealsonbacteria bacterium]